MAGRAEELELIAAHLATLDHDAGTTSRLLVIEGPSGVGKSRLVGDALSSLGEGARRLSVRCLETGGERYQPLTTGLMQLSGMGTVEPSEGQFEDRLLLDLWREIDNGLAVVAVDDLQWADDGTAELLLRLLDTLSTSDRNPVLLATLRTDDGALPESVRSLLRHRSTTRLRLGGVDEEAGYDILVALGAPLRFAETFPELVRLVDGIPLLIEDLAMQLLALGSDRNVPTEPDAVLARIELPGSVAEEARRRVEHLGPDAMSVLGALAVVNDDRLAFVRPLLERLVATDLDDTIDDLEDERLVIADQRTIRLTHPSLRHAVLTGLRRSERRRLHVEIARALLADPASDPVEVVRHLANGRVPVDEDTIVAATRGRRAAIDRHDWRRAVEACNYVFDHVEGRERADVLLALGIARFMLGESAEARLHLEDARHAMRELDDLAGEVWATLGLSRALGTFQPIGAADGVEPGELLDRLPADAHALRADVHVDNAFAAFVGNDLARARGNANIGLDEARVAAAPGIEARALTALGLVEYGECRSDIAVDHYRQAVDLALETGDPLIYVSPAARLPYALLCVGRVREARAAAAELLERLRSMRFTSHMAYAASIVATTAAVQGDLATAQRTWRSLRHWAMETGEVVSTGAAGIAIAVSLGATGDTPNALSRLEQALVPLFGPTALENAYGAGLAALINSENPGRPVLEVGAPSPVIPVVNLYSLGQACVTVEHMRVANAAPDPGVVDVLTGALESGCQVSASPCFIVARSLGRALAGMGDLVAASRHLEDALVLARREDMRLELARTQLDRLELGLVEDDERTEALNDVVASVLDLGLLGLLERLETLDGRVVADVRAQMRNERSPIEPGTAVVLMADIVNSTALTREMGEVEYRHAARHTERLIREGVAAEGGRTVEGVKLGDGALAEFSDVDAAVRAGLAIHRRLEQEPLQLRIGVNHGPVVREGSELFGSAINLAARACDSAEPGAVMVTSAAVAILDGDWLGDLIDEGEFVMKGIEEPVRLFRPIPKERLALLLGPST